MRGEVQEMNGGWRLCFSQPEPGFVGLRGLIGLLFTSKNLYQIINQISSNQNLKIRAIRVIRLIQVQDFYSLLNFFNNRLCCKLFDPKLISSPTSSLNASR